MRYSVVLPRAEPGDAGETKQALQAAAELWSRGDQREALREVRRAAWGCSKSGNDVRALALSKAAKAIQSQLEAAPSGVEIGVLEPTPSTRRDTPRARESVKDPRSAPEAGREPPKSRRPKPSKRPQARQSSPNNRAASRRPAPPITRPATPRADAAAAAPRSGPQTASAVAGQALALSDSEVELDLVVTVAPGAWQDTEAATLVGHRAARVAVAPVAGKKGTFVVRVLGPGEVAPANSAIALLVALEAGSRKLSRAG
jgi:hypothetical protein